MRTLVVLIWLSAVQTATAADAAQPLSITFGGSNVAIGNVSRSATVFVFALVRERNSYYTNIDPVDQRVTDTLGTGSVAVSYNHQRSWRSLWFAADLNTGAFTVGAPPDYVWAKRIVISDSQLKKDAAGEIAQLAMNGEVVEFVVVRPQVGAWSGLITSKSALDDAKQNGKVTVSIGSLAPRAGTAEPPPKKLKKGDIVFMANSFTGEYGAAAVE